MKDRINEWDYLHREQHMGALSGCGFGETIEFLMLERYAPKARNVLEVGVGMGYVTRGLYEAGYNVVAFDISEVALNHVRGWCTATYNLQTIDSLPHNLFDLIICHNVVQHIPTPMLYYELFHFIRSLAPDGIMAIKSVTAEGYDDTGDDPDLVINGIRCADSIGCFCRSVPEFTKIVDRCGGKATLMWDEYINVDYITNQHVFHVTKKRFI